MRIGYIDSMSGPFADVAERQCAGVRAAVEEPNRRGGTQFEVVRADDGTNGDMGVTAGRRLLEQDEVDAIMVGVFSPTALAVGPIAGQHGVFVLLHSAAGHAHHPGRWQTASCSGSFPTR